MDTLLTDTHRELHKKLSAAVNLQIDRYLRVHIDLHTWSIVRDIIFFGIQGPTARFLVDYELKHTDTN